MEAGTAVDTVVVAIVAEVADTAVVAIVAEVVVPIAAVVDTTSIGLVVVDTS